MDSPKGTNSKRNKATRPKLQQVRWIDTYVSLKSTTVSLSSHWPPLDVVIVFTNLAPVARIADGSRRPATPARTPLTRRPASRMVAGGRPSAGAHGGGGGPRRRERRRQCSTTHGSTRRWWPAAGARGHGAHAAEAGGGAPAQAAGGGRTNRPFALCMGWSRWAGPGLVGRSTHRLNRALRAKPSRSC